MAIVGYLDEATRERVRGWARDPAKPRRSVPVIVVVDGLQVARVIANAHRPDLEAAGVGHGRHGFELDGAALGLPLGRCMVHVRFEENGAELANSPARVEPPMRLDGAARDAIRAVLASPGDQAALQDRAAFLAHELDRMMSRLADRHASRAARAAAQSRKWAWRPEDGPEPARLAPRALVIDARMPAPGRDAGSQAIVSHMRGLQRLGYEVVFAPADMQPGPGGATLAEAGIASLHDPWAASIEDVLRRQGGMFDLVYLHRADVASRYVPLCRHYLPRARRVLSVADLQSLRVARQAEVEDRPELLPHARWLHHLETQAAAACHAVITHSGVEAGVLRRALPQAEIVVAAWELPVAATPAPFAARRGVGFIGHYAHAPNVDAAVWLAEIMALAWADAPDIACLLAGSDMPAALRQPRDERMTSQGHVPDLSAWFGGLRLTVAPLAYGAGLKGKVGESLAAGVPCVCTPVAAEGYDLPAPLAGLVAADAAGLAASIVRLHQDPALWEACRTAGLEMAARVFSPIAQDAALRRATGLVEAS